MDLASTEIGPQILMAAIVTIASFVIFLLVETLYKAYINYGTQKITVYPNTGFASKTIVITQNPNNTTSINLPQSDNQLSGIEFSYSTFLYISSDTDTNTLGWKCIFYKGYASGPFPLCGPGVFVSSKSDNTGPTLRVVMNTYETWFNVVDVKQVPMDKWIHLAIVLRNNSLEVYINGNMANKKSFAGSLPYQNYGPLVLFPNYTTTTSDTTWSGSGVKHGIPAGENFVINGKFAGYISNLVYYSYAISYSEVNNSMSLGPSSKFADSGEMDKPPYLIDSWWTQRGV